MTGPHPLEYRPSPMHLNGVDKLLAIFNSFLLYVKRFDDDGADRLNRAYTTIILWIFAFITSAQMIVGNPITCWAPAEFHKSHIRYTNSFCWLQNTYYLPWADHIPKPNERKRVIPYYQWVPFILMVQALCFSIPGIIWGYFNHKSGVNTEDIIEAAMRLQIGENEPSRGKWIRYINEQMKRCITSRKSFKPGLYIDIKKILALLFCNCCGRDQGNYLIVVYVLCKLLYISNIVAQVFLLDIILGNTFHRFGIDFIGGLFDEKRWENTTSYFPQVTMCDMQVRRLGNVHRYTVQCVLPINIFTSKIYLFIWFWFVLLFLVTVISLIKWLFFICFRFYRINYIGKLLEVTKDMSLSLSQRTCLRKFVLSYLKLDGVTLLLLIDKNTSVITTAEIVGELWDKFMDDVREKERAEEYKRNNPSRRRLIVGETV